jgi:hypothetical protein
MSNIYPNKIAFCFLSSSIENTIPQQKEIIKLESHIFVEKWFRYEKFIDNYVSFSQLINDAINDTESEFMVFCNPKTNFIYEDILKIIDKLSNGYCFASVVNFGLFGFTKELIRNIGMLDESLLFGEYEDNDFALRLNLFGKAVWWEYDKNKYDDKQSYYTNNRGISSSIFYTKYQDNIDENKFLLGKNYLNTKKINKRFSEFNRDIYNSWLSIENSYVNCSYGELVLKPSVEIDYRDEIIDECDFTLILEKNDSKYIIELLSNYNISLFFTITETHNNNRGLLLTKRIKSNNWYSFNHFNNDSLEIRIFNQGCQIYNNYIFRNGKQIIDFKLPVKIRVD